MTGKMELTPSKAPWDHERKHLSAEEANIPLPKTWIEPEVVAATLAPYYTAIVKDYAAWLDKPHTNLAGIAGRDAIIPLYAPRNPQKQGKPLSTYPVYESIYLTAAGIITGGISPVPGMKSEQATELKGQITRGLLENMAVISGLGNGTITFDTGTTPATQLNKPRIITDQARRPFVFSHGALNDTASTTTQYDPELNRFKIKYQEVDPEVAYPATGKSLVSFTGLDRMRATQDEQRSHLDVEVSMLGWTRLNNGRYVPITHRNLMSEYLGPNTHHIDLFSAQGKNGRHLIANINRAVLRELGLSPLVDFPMR